MNSGKPTTRTAVPMRPSGSIPSTANLYSAAANILKNAVGSSAQSSTSTSNPPAPVLKPNPATAPAYAIVKFTLVNTEEFTATATGPLNKSVVDVMKKIQGIRYDPETKRIVFPIESHDALQVSLASLRIGVEPLMRSTIAAAQLQNSRKKQMNPIDVETDLRDRVHPRLLDSLADFQKEGVIFTLRNDGRVLIADEMGLGKTRQAIAAAVMYREDWPVLIISPSSARYHWLHELTNLLCPECLAPHEIALVENQHYIHQPSHHIVIVSYTLVQKLSTMLHRINFNVAIADESHFLKNIKTLRSQSLLPLLKKSKRAILLSGTPALSRPMELFTQLHVLAPSTWPDEKEFARRYCRNSRGKYWSDNRGASNTQELHVMLSSTVMIRRLKNDVMQRLPKKRRGIVKLTIADNEVAVKFRGVLDKITAHDEMIAMNAADKSKRHRSSEGSSFDDEFRAAQDIDGVKDRKKSYLLELFSASGVAKLPCFLEHLSLFLDDPMAGKVLVFAHHRSVLDEIDQYLSNRGAVHIRIDGQTLSKDRYSRVNYFQETPTCRVAVLAITAAGIAISLTSASTVFFVELFWTPGSLIQAEDRVHRIGQTAPVKIFYFLAENTIDDIVWPMVRQKMQLLGEVVEGRDTDDMLDEETDIVESVVDDKFMMDIEVLVSEIVKEDEKALRAAKVNDDEEDDEEVEYLNASTHSNASLDFSGHGEMLMNRSSHGDALNRSTHSDMNHSSHGDHEWLDEFLEIDPLAEIFINEVLPAEKKPEPQEPGQDAEDAVTWTPSFSKSN